MKLISNQISPNLIVTDFFAGFLALFLPKKSRDFSAIFGKHPYFLSNAVRTELSLLIKVLDLPKDKKIALPAFTCAVLATPFLTAGYEIEWIDTDENGLILYKNFEQISDNISLVVAIHTFGQEIDLRPFTDLCRKKNIVLLEDCAHFLPSASDDFLSDVRLFSFGREKILSCVSGGGITINKFKIQNSKFKISEATIKKQHEALPKAPIFWQLRYLSHPLIYSLALPIWHMGGKFFPAIFQKIKWLPKAVTFAEKRGVEDLPALTLPKSLQAILHRQVLQQEKTVLHREKIAKYWQEKLSKFFNQEQIICPKNNFRVILKNLTIAQKNTLIKATKSFHLTEWNGNPIAPNGVDLSAFGYQSGQCKIAENFSRHHLTLPTNRRVFTADIDRFIAALELKKCAL